MIIPIFLYKHYLIFFKDQEENQHEGDYVVVVEKEEIEEKYK